MLLDTFKLMLLSVAFLSGGNHGLDLFSFVPTALLSSPKFWNDCLLGTNDLEGVNGHNRK